MTHPVAAYCLAGLAAVACAGSAFAQSHPRPSGLVEVLVDGEAVTRYTHDGRSYVEALKGRDYAIRLRNPYRVRVAVALSVDGLNTIDARESTAMNARKWVLDPYETVTIRGWQTSRTEARAFEFTTEARSYGAALGKTTNLGVISAVFFRERVAPPAPIAREDTARNRANAGSEPLAAPLPASPAAQEASQAAAGARRAEDDFAATGMGGRTSHVVTEVRLDLENVPAQSVDIRYEFRAQLVRLGIIPATPANDPLTRRERARGFEPGFAPVPPDRR